MSVYYSDDDVTIHHANALDLPIDDATVDLVCTSPPYFGLRSYQDGGEHYAGQIGSEATPAEFADALIAATREMVRVLKPGGSIWVNLGDRFSDGFHLDRQGMTIEDAAWLAGVIDSDGSISVHANKQPEGRAPSFVPWVRVGQMRPEVVQQIAAVTGVGKAWQDGRGVWNWSAAAQQAATVLRWIWPWLRIKQRQGLAAVELARHIAEKRNRGTWSRVADEDVAYRQSIRDAVLDWNGGRPNDYDPPRLPYPNLPQRRTWVPAKSLVGVPWRYALRCIDDLGLILRAEIIWSKPNGLPESVTDRVRRSHETWFHFVRQPRYFSAVDEVREPTSDYSGASWADRKAAGFPSRAGQQTAASMGSGLATNPLGKLPGSVWTIPTQPLRVPDHLGIDHFAAFPMEFPRRIIRGWSPSGICVECGEGRRPEVTSVGLDMSRPQARRAQQLADEGGLTEDHLAALLSVGVSDTGRGKATQSGTGKNTTEVYRLADEARAVLGGYSREYLLRRPTTFRDVCACPEPTAPTRPAVILDPFGGTGTVGVVARALGRHVHLVDLSADYCRLAKWRVTDPGELARAMQVDKPEPVPEDQASLLDLLGDAS